jgi:rubredoxin
MSGKMEKQWECQICGYIYDPKRGVLAQGINRGVPFQKLPASFNCPGCGSDKDLFAAIEEPLENGVDG